MSKFLCLLATKKGLEVLISAIDAGYSDSIGCVMTFCEKVSIDYQGEIIEVCNKHKIPHFHYNQNEGPSLIYSVIEEMQISSIVAIGWRFLLPLELNEKLTIPIIVFHDSLLPKYRGFAPTPTAMMCGETTVGVTALFASEKVDQGDIIWQKEIHVPIFNFACVFAAHFGKAFR